MSNSIYEVWTPRDLKELHDLLKDPKKSIDLICQKLRRDKDDVVSKIAEIDKSPAPVEKLSGVPKTITTSITTKPDVCIDELLILKAENKNHLAMIDILKSEINQLKNELNTLKTSERGEMVAYFISTQEEQGFSIFRAPSIGRKL